jgi:nucleoside-diphosphate-sugar epimerase
VEEEQIRMRTALVTGGAGFIGSHVAEHLLEQGWRVRILDDFSSGRRGNMPCHQEVSVVEGDIRDESVCLRACEGVDSLFHLAAIASVGGSIADPALSNDVNVVGTLNLLLAARENGVRRFVFSSSAAVYGNAAAQPVDEDQPVSPQSPYASTKAAGEFYCRNFWELYGLEVVILRYFNVFGPRQGVNSGYAAVIPAFTQAVVTETRPVIYGDGLQTRDFVYVDNVARANIRAALAPGVAGQTFNIASGQGTTLLDLLSELAKITGKRIKPRFEAGRAGEVRDSYASIARAKRALGYEPTVPYVAGLHQTVEAAMSTYASGLSLSPV